MIDTLVSAYWVASGAHSGCETCHVTDGCIKHHCIRVMDSTQTGQWILKNDCQQEHLSAGYGISQHFIRYHVTFG